MSLQQVLTPVLRSQILLQSKAACLMKTCNKNVPAESKVSDMLLKHKLSKSQSKFNIEINHLAHIHNHLGFRAVLVETMEVLLRYSSLSLSYIQ